MRGVVVASVILCLAAVTVVVLGGPASERYTLQVANAGQLVKGNLVKVGGAKAGVVRSIELGSDNQARVVIEVQDKDVLPLRRGTRAEIRLSSLSSVAGRYVSLLLGPNDAPPLDPDTAIRAVDVSVPVELDQLLSILNGETRRAFRAALRGSATLYRGRGRAANDALRALNPALTELAATAREIGRDDARLERFLVQSAAAVGVVAERNRAVDAGLQDAATTATTLADRRSRVEQVLERTPRALSRARSTLSRLTEAGDDVEAALRDARPVAPRLDALITSLDRVLPRARPALDAVGRLAPRTTSALRALPAVSRAAAPAFRDATEALADADPVIAGSRPYLPDVVHGFLSGFGGQTFTYYDANGHYGRVRPIVYAGTSQTAGALSSLLGVSLAGDAERRYLLRRCPGSATVPAPDGSNPFEPSGDPCDPKQVP